jgi:hypothetical protein
VPRLYNIDHSPASVENGPSVLPGETYDFTDEQVAAGIAGLWSENDPRGPAVREPMASVPVPEQTTEPAEPDQQTADPAEKE